MNAPFQEYNTGYPSVCDCTEKNTENRTRNLFTNSM